MYHFTLPRTGVLVVDRDQDVRAVLCAELEALDLVPVTADSVPGAMNELSRHRHRVDLAVVEWLPGGQGESLASKLRSLHPDLRCCVLSSGLESDEDLLAGGADRVLRKPFALPELAEALLALGQPAA